MWFLRLIASVVVAVAALAPSASSAPHEIVNKFGYGPSTPAGTLVFGPDGYYWGTSSAGGFPRAGTVYKVKPDGSDLRVVYSFGAKTDDADGAVPASGLTYDGAGFMWGTTLGGGVGFGTVFKVKVSDGTLTTLVKFGEGANKGGSPRGPLLKAGAFMWGTASSGGAGQFGTVFKVSGAGKLTTVAEFTGNGATNKGAVPYGGLIFDGKLLWGMTSAGGASNFGTVFAIDAKGKLTTVIEFTGNGAVNKGSAPVSELVSDGAGALWGMTSGGGAGGFGTIFKLDTTVTPNVLATLVNFTDNGATNKGSNPRSALVSDGAGAFWGTTTQGGAANVGTAFKIAQTFNPATDAIVTEAEFTGVFTTGFFSGAAAVAQTGVVPNGLVKDGAGDFVGTAAGGGENRGRIFKLSHANGALIPLADLLGLALQPGGGLTADAAGNLWGITGNITETAGGLVYRYTRGTGLRTNMAVFPNLNTIDTGYPAVRLFFDGAHTMWGTTDAGGDSQFRVGDIFTVDTINGGLTEVVSFGAPGTSTYGNTPTASLVSDGLGFLWGTNYYGGSNSFGTVFKISPTTRAFSLILSFSDTGASNHGKNPSHELVDDGIDSMWGTNAGGLNGGGTEIFKINKTSGVLTTIMEFPFTTGFGGVAPKLGINDGAGNIWGVSRDAILKINIATNAITSYPTTRPSNGNLVADGLGALWDTSFDGGGGRGGSIIKIDLATGALATVMEFGGNGTLPGDSQYPSGPLYLAPDGYFYGTASDGASNHGAIFRVNASATVTPNLETIAVVGAPAPDSSGGFATFASFHSPQPGFFGGTVTIGGKKVGAVMAPDGTFRVLPNGGTEYGKVGEPCGTAELVTLRFQGFNTAKNDEVLLGNIGFTPKFVARKGDLVAGPAGGYIKKFLAFDGNGPPYFFVAVLDRFGPTVTSLCVTLADGDSINFNTERALVRIGGNIDGHATTNTVKTLGTLVALKGTIAEGRWRLDANHFGARLTLSDKSQVLFSMPSSATMSTASEWTRFLGTGDPFGNFKIGALGFPGFGALGPATVVTLIDGTMPVDPAHDTLVVRSEAASDTVLARKGDSAPDAAGVAIPNAVFKTFGDPVSGSAGKTAFMATLGGVTTGASGIWYAADGATLKELARVGDPAPGGGHWASFTQLVLPDGAKSGPHFLGTLAVDKAANISTANNTGIWSVKSDGALQLTFRTGAQFDVNGAGKLLTVKSFTAFQAAVDSLGAARGYDDSGHVAVLATFTDKTVAMLRLTVP